MIYCAHAIFYFKLVSRQQDTFLVHENVYLIEADSDKEAAVLAEAVALENEDQSEDGHLEVNGEKAAYLYADIRKIIEVESGHDADKTGLHGVELTYSVLEVDSFDEVLKLARAEMVDVLYRE